MKRETVFEKNYPYHILSRAIEEKKIFAREEDCYRFIFQMYAANIGRPILNLWRKDVIKCAKAILNGKEVSSKFIIKEHSPLVGILSFSLVINHYHFNLVPLVDGGIFKYMHKLNTGFAKYYNLKYNRKGTLFESRYKSIDIKGDFQLNAITRYINIINPLDVYQPGWREERLYNYQQAFKFLYSYKFSSFPNIFGKRSSKILASEKFLKIYLKEKQLGNRKDNIEFVKDFLKEKMVCDYLFLE